MDALLTAARTPMKWLDAVLANRPVRLALMLVLDAAVATLALYLAFVLRFEGDIPDAYAARIASLIPVFALTRAGLTYVFGLHRWSFRMSGLSEGTRLALAVTIGTVLILAFRGLFERVNVPRSVVAFEFFLSAALMATYRFAPRLLAGWYLEQRRYWDAEARRAVIVGAGSAGELLIRDLLRSPANPYQVVAFLDDDRNKRGTHIGGRPVLGAIETLPRIVAREAITDVLIAIPRLSSERIREILKLCSSLKLSFKIIPASFAVLDQKISAAMLHDLTPEDLLPRDEIRFDEEEIARQVAGKRILITGAGGSIGSEIARQVASHDPASLVLLDINENEMYLLARRLEELHPDVAIHTIVGDIRDAARIERLGSRFRPQYVFHAAAHKHVPLMEDAPEEAIKNNVFGTMNVARMADACGAERFVLISTDKAVRPSSVMGASKRIAELVVRELAARSKTAFTAVRFGNVLGSAGSVVPIFKQQIQRGGPVTVTHPECTRYFMTIPEAVGLVLLAGLGGYGELCILDMGQPIRIAELASNLITMAGLVPGKDIPIVYTGLRPGEKLAETLLSEDEERTQIVRDRILVAQSPRPVADLQERLEKLRRAADAGDTTAVKTLIRSIVPSYAPLPALVHEAPNPKEVRGGLVSAA